MNRLQRSILVSSLSGTAALAALNFLAQNADAQTFTDQQIAATANLYGAGRTGGAATPAPAGSGGGTVAPSFALTAGTGRELTFSSVTGTVIINLGTGDTQNNADGIGNTNSTNFNPYQGISGVSFAGRAGYLTGVFINGAPANYADFSTGSDASNSPYTDAVAASETFAPLLNQAFFIGDGLTGNGSGLTQRFFVPDGATTLVLGFEDAPGYNGGPGAYGDNGGSFSASFSVTGAAVVPEANSFTLALPALGMVGAVVIKRRKK